jgi:hypothetical protein
MANGMNAYRNCETRSARPIAFFLLALTFSVGIMIWPMVGAEPVKQKTSAPAGSAIRPVPRGSDATAMNAASKSGGAVAQNTNHPRIIQSSRRHSIQGEWVEKPEDWLRMRCIGHPIDMSLIDMRFDPGAFDRK